MAHKDWFGRKSLTLRSEEVFVKTASLSKFTLNGTRILTTADSLPPTTLTIGTTSTLAPGNPATVVNVGTPSAAILDFGIPQGVAGVAGQPGDPTVMGPVGAAPNANAGTIVGNTLTLQPCSSAFPGVVTTGNQDFEGIKNFTQAWSVQGGNDFNFYGFPITQVYTPDLDVGTIDAPAPYQITFRGQGIARFLFANIRQNAGNVTAVTGVPTRIRLNGASPLPDDFGPPSSIDIVFLVPFVNMGLPATGKLTYAADGNIYLEDLTGANLVPPFGFERFQFGIND